MGKMAARLGVLVYWLCFVVSALLAVLALATMPFQYSIRPNVEAFILSLIIYALGWGVLRLLARE